MNPKAKFWADFFNYLFRVVTFKKIMPQPEKMKRLLFYVVSKPLRITQHYVNVWRGWCVSVVCIYKKSWLTLMNY